MPRVVQDHSDERNKSWCIHCGRWLVDVRLTRDHTPSKFLLDRPFPADLAVTPVCEPCNNGFSLDEEYFSAFLSAVLSGTTEPDEQVIGQAGKSIRRSARLRALIESQRVEQFCLFGPSDVTWYPDVNRIRKVIIKNARAHLFYENGEPMLEEPTEVFIKPIPRMAQDETWQYFDQEMIQPWCEVGSRWNTRLIEGDSFDGQGFLIVQPGIYRIRVEAGGLGIKTVIREYLATSVFWGSS